MIQIKQHQKYIYFKNFIKINDTQKNLMCINFFAKISEKVIKSFCFYIKEIV